MPDCLTWLHDERYASTSNLDPQATADLLQSFESCLTLSPTSRSRYKSSKLLGWTLAGVSGAMVGALLSALLYAEDQTFPQLSVILGGPAGAGIFVLLFGLLTSASHYKQQDSVLSALSKVAPGYSCGHPSNSKSQELTRWIAESLRLNANMVLALCWVYSRAQRLKPVPARHKAKVETEFVKDKNEPISVYQVIGSLDHALHQNNVDSAEVRDLVEELLQRFGDEGFEWREVDGGTPYSEAMERHFDTFGHIEVGQPVKTLRAALLQLGAVKKRGQLQRIR